MTGHRDLRAHREHAASFGKGADAYEAARPGYPDEAARWLVPEGAERVLDVGAGTGKLTRLLQRGDREVIAVDPSAEMLATLRDRVPGVETLLGTAERMPLPDESVDAITVAQAWHWVDRERGPREVARVLKPGGTLGLVWNTRDDRIGWVRELGEAMGENDRYSPAILDENPVGEGFTDAEAAEFPWIQKLTRPRLLTLVRSRSYFLVKTPDEQSATLRAVEAVLDRHPGLFADGELGLPYITQAFRFRRV